MTPLHMAAESARVNIVEHLVKEGADINIQDTNKVYETALLIHSM